MLGRKRRGLLQCDVLFACSQCGRRYGGIESARAGGGGQRGGWQARVAVQLKVGKEKVLMPVRAREISLGRPGLHSLVHRHLDLNFN